jgi:hypothetical protein
VQFPPDRLHADGMAGAAALLVLSEYGLVLHDGGGLLQYPDLVCSGRLALLVAIGLGSALELSLAVILIDGVELRVRRLAVARVLGSAFVEADWFVNLAVDVLNLCGLGDCVLLISLLVLCERISLCGLFSGKIIGGFGLDQF